MNNKKISAEDMAKLKRLAGDADVQIARAQLAVLERDQFAEGLSTKYEISGPYQLAPDGTIHQGTPAPAPTRRQRRAAARAK